MEVKCHLIFRFQTPAGRNQVLACVLVDPANDKSQSLLLPAALSIIKGKDWYGWNEEEADGGGGQAEGWRERAGEEENESRRACPETAGTDAADCSVEWIGPSSLPMCHERCYPALAASNLLPGITKQKDPNHASNGKDLDVICVSWEKDAWARAECHQRVDKLIPN